MILKNDRVFIFLLQKPQKKTQTERERECVRKKITEPSGERNVDVGFSFSYIYLYATSVHVKKVFRMFVRLLEKTKTIEMLREDSNELGAWTTSESLPPCHLLTRTNDSSRFIASLAADDFKHRRKVRAHIAEY